MRNDLAMTFVHALWQPSDFIDDRWTLQHEQQVIHFNRTKLTEREALLLSLLLPETENIPKPETTCEKSWHDYLYGHAKHPDHTSTYTAVHFHLEQTLEDTSSFREAVLGSFPIGTSLIWKTAERGMLLFKPEGDFLDLSAIAELIESDFYTKVQLFLGAPTKEPDVKESFLFEDKLFANQLQKRSGKTVFTAAEAGLSYLLEHMPNGIHTKLQQHFFPSEVLNDEALLQTVHVYLLNNMNNSQTAKELHLHRNSLQYRIDKFMSLTGIDIRIFYHAVFTALLLPRK